MPVMVSLRTLPPNRVRGPVPSRLLRDTHVLLGIAIVASAIVIEGILSPDALLEVTLAGLAYIALQGALALRPRRRQRSTTRLLVAVAFLYVIGLIVGPAAGLPLAALCLAIVSVAAAYGNRQALVVGATACILMLAPVFAGLVPVDNVLARGPAFLATMLLLAVGTRRTVGALESAVARARTSMVRERRQARQMAGVEAVGRLLAQEPSADALDDAMDLLVQRFGYRFVSIYLKADDGTLVLGAQRGYERVLERFDGTGGVIGRVMRTGEVQHVRDIRLDPDYQSADDTVLSEISAPLFAGGELIGVINLEDPRVGGLDDTDRSTLILIAERLAGAIALGRDRQALRERADRFSALAEFARRINATLDPGMTYPAICEAVSSVVPCDVAVLVLHDRIMGDYRIAAMSGPNQQFVGVSIPADDGTAGVAMAERRMVVQDRLDPDQYPATMRTNRSVPVVTMAVPLLKDDEVIGALSFVRRDLHAPFGLLDREVAPIVAGQVALAIANAWLHTQVSDAAIRDSLTGLANRRHLDASLERMAAARERLPMDERRPLSAILFDLDHFGDFNKRHGHRVGDAVLRTFATLLTGRFRASDIVARYGGEEFLVVMDGASLDEARRVAEEIRAAFAATPVDSPSGKLSATVSAGCSALGPSVNSVTTLLEVADVALQMAKRGGRNQVVAA